jgi:hypothetical protein
LLLDSKNLTERIKKDYDHLGLIPNLNESDLYSGRYCVYYASEYQVYKRARINDYDKRTGCVTIYLIDFGKTCETSQDKLFGLLRTYYSIEPLCFECTFELEYPFQAEQMVVAHFRSLVEKYGKIFKMKMHHELTMTGKKKYFVDLFAKSTNKEFDFNIREDLKNFVMSNCNRVKSNAPSSNDLQPFSQDDLPLDTPLKAQLTTLDTVKHFGIVALNDAKKREKFMADFHKWHKENKKALKLITEQNKKPSVGTPCTVNSVQVGKWCRGIIANSESQMSQIYLVDHCRTQEVSSILLLFQ